MTNFIGTPQDNTFRLTPGKDWVEIQPAAGHDTVVNFEPGTDLLVFNGFGTMSPDPIIPWTTINDNDTVTIDLSAARGLESGLQTVLLTDTVEFGHDDMVFNIGVMPNQDTHGIGLPPEPVNPDFRQEKVVHDFDDQDPLSATRVVEVIPLPSLPPEPDPGPIFRPAVSDRIDAVDPTRIPSSVVEDRLDAQSPLDGIDLVGVADRFDFADFTA
jgi:hypothetical protein